MSEFTCPSAGTGAFDLKANTRDPESDSVESAAAAAATPLRFIISEDANALANPEPSISEESASSTRDPTAAFSKDDESKPNDAREGMKRSPPPPPPHWDEEAFNNDAFNEDAFSEETLLALLLPGVPAFNALRCHRGTDVSIGTDKSHADCTESSSFSDNDMAFVLSEVE